MATRPGLRRVLTAIVTASLLAGCGEQVGTADGGDVDLAGSWHLVDGRDAEGTLDLTGGTITLQVQEAQVGGVSACNHYSGRLHVEGDQVRLTGLGGTEMGCDPPVMALEQRYLAALDAVEQGERSAERLTLSGPDVALDFELDPPVQDAALVGTSWVLESLVEGDTVASVLGDGALRFEDGEDGATFEGSSGCRTVKGSYLLDGDDVTVTRWEAGRADAGACPPDLEAQHDHVVAVLEGGFTASIKGDRLTLTGRAGKGLDFRAR